MRIKSKQLEKSIFVFIILGLNLLFIFSVKFNFIVLLTIVVSLLTKITVALFIIGWILVILGALGSYFVTPFSWKSFKSLFGAIDNEGEQLFIYPIDGILYRNIFYKIGFKLTILSLLIFCTFVLPIGSNILNLSPVDNIAFKKDIIFLISMSILTLLLYFIVSDSCDEEDIIVRFYKEGVYISAYKTIILWNHFEKAEIKGNNLILYVKGVSNIGKDKIALPVTSELLSITEQYLKVLKT